MRELSLFTGAGGGVLGTALLGWRPVGYVDADPYCQRIIRQRIDDGVLHDAPIFGDIRAFNGEGYAKSYSGLVEVITAGFPCQPFSTAGNQRGADDDRNLWPETFATICEVGPRYVFLENVPGLLVSGYFGRIVADLATRGFYVRWCVLSAAALGAPHRRARLWIVAHYQSGGRVQVNCNPNTNTNGRLRIQAVHRTACDVEKQTGHDVDGFCAPIPNAVRGGRDRIRAKPEWPDVGAVCQTGGPWTRQPRICRMANGVANRVDRLRAIGNGQVPIVVASAWRMLTEDLDQ